MKYKIFVSGAQKELKNERFAVKELIEGNVLLKEYFDVFLAEKVSLDELSDSDIYAGLFWNEYGMVPKDAVSATEKEYLLAKKEGKEILVFIKGSDESKRDKRLKTLILKIKDDKFGHCYERFENTTELKNALFNSLVDFMKKEGIIGKNIFDESVCKNASLSDIDEEKVRWFLRIAKEKHKFPLSLDAKVEDVLVHLNLLNNGRPTNAAILLFGKNPHRFCLQAEVKCIQFPGTEVEKPFTSYHIYDENLFEQIDKSVAFVLDAIRYSLARQEHTVQVKRQYEIPLFAIQEAIVNAVAHRDYNNTAGVQVMVFVDRVEVWNPGRLPDTLSVNDLKKPHTSHPYNPLLAGPLYLADYIQKAGSGTVEMMRQCVAQGLPEPEFVSTRWEFRTILARDIFMESIVNKLGLNDRQLRAVKYVKEKGRIANKEYQELVKVKKRQATDDLKGLENKGIFYRIGVTGKGTYYILKGHQRGERGTKGANNVLTNGSNGVNLAHKMAHNQLRREN